MALMQDHEDQTELHDEDVAELTGDTAPEEAAGAGVFAPEELQHDTAEAEQQHELQHPEAANIPMDDGSMSWYIIHTYSGFEKKVRDSLVTRAEAFGFRDQIGEILIPEEDVAEMRAGKKVVSKRLVYPGYVILQLQMSDNMRHFIKDTPRVTGFVGGGTDPVPLTADEVNGILYRQTTTAEKPRPKLTFEKNETVRIIDGPFANFTGKVDEINNERNTMRVLVTIFGRATPVELDFLQVEKI
jgi:transcriptional antiterminator NusG